MTEQWSMKVQGLDGEIELLKDRIIISRNGWLSAMTGPNRRELPYSSVLEVHLKDATKLAPGHLEIMRVGIPSTDDNSAFRVKFKKDKQAEFAKIKDKIYEILNYYAQKK